MFPFGARQALVHVYHTKMVLFSVPVQGRVLGMFTLVLSENRTRAPSSGTKCEHSLEVSTLL